MTLITLLLMLLVVATVIYGITLAFAGKWKEVFILLVVVLLAVWILGAFGLSLPTIGR